MGSPTSTRTWGGGGAIVVTGWGRVGGEGARVRCEKRVTHNLVSDQCTEHSDEGRLHNHGGEGLSDPCALLPSKPVHTPG
jgi:hypothetical protein